MRKVFARRDLPQSAKLLAAMLAQTFADAETGRAWPSKAVLAEALAVSPDTVKRAIRRLEAARFLDVERRRGRGRASVYQLAFPAGSEPEKGCTVVPFPAAKRVQTRSKKGCSAAPPYKNPVRNPNTRTREARRDAPQAAQTPEAKAQARESVEQLWATTIAEGRYVPPSALSPHRLRGMIARNLVTEAQVRALGLL
ncbi:MAG: helix-turn-helix domain-containing protein [Pseudomonadota bacterium]